jgi:heme/copper-type cytochrome/quinol oxidase subunit 1
LGTVRSDSAADPDRSRLRRCDVARPEEKPAAMTVTETQAPPAAETTAPALAPPRPATGIAAVLGSGEHKTIGRLWIFTAFVHLVIAGVTGALVGVERVDTSGLGDVLDADVFAQTYSLHAVAGTFLFLLPLLLGLAIHVVPLQVGSATLAFPRAAAAAYWTYLIGGGVLIASFLADGGPFGGDAEAVELFVASFIAVLVALTLAAICVATTVFALRAPGMGLHRTPLFSWSSLVTAALVVLTLPVLAALMLLVYVDHRYGPTFLGGSDGVFARIAWAWGQPSVYVFAIPVLGIVGDIVPVAARTRITLHRVAMGCIGAFGLFAFGAWAMPGFSPTDDTASSLEFVGEVPFYAFSILVLLPALAFAGLLGDTLRRGSLALTSPLLWAMSALLMLLAGAANGILVSIEPFDLVGTTAQAAQAHYVLVAALLGLFAGLVHWAPKLFGTLVPELPSKVLAGLALVATVLLCLPDLITGFLEQSARLGGVTDDVDAVEALNVVSIAGGLLLVLVALAFVGLVFKAAAGPADAGDDPWEGHTLEWATTSPPPAGNFAAALPAITSEAPVYDARHGAGTSTTEAQS